MDEEDINKLIGMIGNYDDRLVGNYKCDKYTIDTCKVFDSGNRLYETALEHTDFNNGSWMIVEKYTTIEGAKDGHERWVEYMGSPNIKVIFDVNPWIEDVTVRQIKIKKWGDKTVAKTL